MTANALHAAATFRSEETAEAIFGGLFGLPRIKTFDVGPDLCGTLFGIERGARIIQYDAGAAAFEVFVDPAAPPPAPRFEHIAVEVADREHTLSRAAGMGMEVRRFVAGGKEVVFLRDGDGNLYEIKQIA